jgi:hypothetical protein
MTWKKRAVATRVKLHITKKLILRLKVFYVEIYSTIRGYSIGGQSI